MLISLSTLNKLQHLLAALSRPAGAKESNPRTGEHAMHRVALDFVGGRFEARFFCRDQQRWLTWAGAELREVQGKVARYFAGTKHRVKMTREAAAR